MGGADHQRHRLGLHLPDAAMLAGVLLVGAVHQDVPEFVGERLDLRGGVHVLPDRDRLRRVVRHTVGAVDHALVRHPQHGEPAILNQLGQTVPQPDRCFAFQQLRCRWFRDRVTGSLRGVPHVGGLGGNHF